MTIYNTSSLQFTYLPCQLMKFSIQAEFFDTRLVGKLINAKTIIMAIFDNIVTYRISLALHAKKKIALLFHWF